jgi:hypothetical protein
MLLLNDALVCKKLPDKRAILPLNDAEVCKKLPDKRAILELNEALAATSTEAVDSRFVSLILFDPES